jgi:hypothetical protein
MKKKKGRPKGKLNKKTLLAIAIADGSNSGKFLTVFWIESSFQNTVLIHMVYSEWNLRNQVGSFTWSIDSSLE